MEKPILFNTQMVKAILNGSKTQTRRLIKPQPPCALKQMTEGHHAGEWHLYRDSPMMNPMINSPWGAQYLPPCQVGDTLWVRETWKQATSCPGGGGYMLTDHILYKADEPFDTSGMMVEDRWHPSIHMRRIDARLFLRVKNVRVERLQDISVADIDAEGCKEYAYSTTTGELLPSRPIWFKILWNETIKPADLPRFGWDANPWVWVIEFERLDEKPAGLWDDQDTAQYADQDVLMPAT